MLAAVGVAGVIATAATAWTVAKSPILVGRTADAVWRSLFVAGYFAAGVHAWWRQPDSRLGPIVAGYGLLYSVTSMNASADALVHTVGMAVWAVYIVYTGYVFLCFPRGRLEWQLERRFMLAFALSAVVVWGLILPLSPTIPAGSDFTNCGTACPPNALQIVTGHVATGMALITAFDVIFTLGAIGVAMLVFYKARSATHLRRRAMTPLAVVVLVNIAEFVVSLFVPAAFPGTRETLKVINGLTTLAVPAAIFAGQVRGAMFAAVSLGRIVVRQSGKALTPVSVENLIADALGDSTLRLALWAPERGGYIDVGGDAVELSTVTRASGITRVDRDGLPVAALIHDPSLDTDLDVVQGLAVSALMLLENARLVEELRASRARIVSTAQRERQRLEQDLHDGAQQRLTAILIRLRIAQEHAKRDGLGAELEAISLEAEGAIEELRALAHGLYPTVLSARGLPQALRSVALRALTVVSVVDEGIGRCSPAVEAAIYFCSVEAIQNAIKHAGSEAKVAVTLGRDGPAVHFAIVDTGVGITKRPGDGMGLTSMRDRIGAVGGELEIISTRGMGTTVRGAVPDERPSA